MNVHKIHDCPASYNSNELLLYFVQRCLRQSNLFLRLLYFFYCDFLRNWFVRLSNSCEHAFLPLGFSISFPGLCNGQSGRLRTFLLFFLPSTCNTLLYQPVLAVNPKQLFRTARSNGGHKTDAHQRLVSLFTTTIIYCKQKQNICVYTLKFTLFL